MFVLNENTASKCSETAKLDRRAAWNQLIGSICAWRADTETLPKHLVWALVSPFLSTVASPRKFNRISGSSTELDGTSDDQETTL